MNSAGLSRRQVFLFPYAYSLAMGGVFVALPLWGVKLGATSVHLGATGSILSGTLALLGVLFGRLSDRIGRERMMAAGAFVSAGTMCAIPLMTRPEWLFGAAALFGISFAMYWPSIEAKVAESTDTDGLAGHLSTFNMGWAAGNASGSFLAGFVLTRNPAWVFYGAAGVHVVLCMRLLLGHLPRAGRSVGAPSTEAQDQHRPEEADAFLRLARIAGFAVFFSVASIRWLFPKLAVSLDMPKGTIGVLLGTVAAAQGLTFLVMGWVHRWQYTFRAMLLAQIFPVMGLLLVWFGQSALAFGVALFTVGLGSGMAFTMGLFYSLHGHHAKGSNAGLHEAILGMGHMAGPILGGVAARYTSLRIPSLLNIAIIVLAIAGQCVLWWWARRRSRTSASGRVDESRYVAS